MQLLNNRSFTINNTTHLHSLVKSLTLKPYIIFLTLLTLKPSLNTPQTHLLLQALFTMKIPKTASSTKKSSKKTPKVTQPKPLKVVRPSPLITAPPSSSSEPKQSNPLVLQSCMAVQNAKTQHPKEDHHPDH